MKKLLIFVVMLISFSLVYYTFNEKNMDDVSRLMTFSGNLEETVGLKPNTLNISFENSKFEDIYHQIGIYAKENDLIVIASDKNIDEQGLYTDVNFYVYSDNSHILDNICVLGSKIDFSDLSTKKYYSTTTDKNSEGKIKLLDDNFLEKYKNRIKICSYNMMKVQGLENLDSMFITVYSDGLNLENELQAYLTGFDQSIKVINAGQEHNHADIDENFINENLGKTILVTMIVFITVMSTLIIRKNRQYMIRRMMGTSALKIACLEFFKLFLGSIIAFIISNLLSFWILYQEINKLTLSFLEMIIQYNLYFIIVLLVIFIFNWIFIYFSCSLKYLNTKNNLGRLFNLHIIIKVIMIIFLMSPFIISLKDSIPYLTSYLKVSSVENEIDDLYFLNEIPENSDKIFEKYIDDCYYANFSEYYGVNRTAELMNDYSSIYPYPYIHANVKYLKSHNLMDLDNNKIDYNKYEDNVLLVPEIYKDKDLTQYPSNVEIVYIKNTDTFVNYKAQGVYYVNNPIILLEKKYSYTETNMNELAIKTDNINELKKELLEINGIKVNIQNARYFYDLFMEQTKTALVEFGVTIGIYLIVYLTLVFQSIFMYLEERGKNIAINYSLGVSRIKRHFELWLFNLGSYMLILAGSFKLSLMLSERVMFVLCFMILELLIEMICIIYFENRKMSNWLKGEK